MVCKNCGKAFSLRVRIDGEIHSLQNRKYCLECSPYKSHNTRQLDRYKKYIKEGRLVEKECSQCGEIKPIEEYYNNGNRPHSFCKKCLNLKSVERFRERKLWAIDYKGGECQMCGYNKYAGALEFHHLDPNIKDFTIDRYNKLSKDRLKVELDKCILLCANCHRELHYELKNPSS
jgi:hypothetical protein